MCKRLSERAADDLLAFVREVRREEAGVPNYAVRGVCYEKLQHLAARALSIMDKHGLLTPADDPEVAAVFMGNDEEDAPLRCPTCTGTNVVRRGYHGSGHFGGDMDVSVYDCQTCRNLWSD